MIDTIKARLFGDDEVDMSVKICPEQHRDALRGACGGDNRWLYAGTPTGYDVVWLLGGEEDEPSSDRATRTADALSHETMHIVLENEVGFEATTQYDDMLHNVITPTMYLHYYAHCERDEKAGEIDD